jgi:heat shock protein HtpX
VRRKDFGRDLELSMRMALALAIIGAIYLVAEALLLLVTIISVRAGDIWASLGGLMFAASIPFLLVAQLRRAGSYALRRTQAHVIPEGREQALEALVARVAAQADLPAPSLAVVDVATPNAFAVGTTHGNSVVALTKGLLERLDEKEIEAVVGHELAHVANRDSAVMTFASGPAMAGWAMWHDSDWRGKFVFVLFSPLQLLNLLLMWSISRYREYVADRGSAMITGAPEQLMSALAKIGGEVPKGDLRGGAAISALCIVSARPRRRLELFMDHPPLDKRLRRLEEIAREMGRPV